MTESAREWLSRHGVKIAGSEHKHGRAGWTQVQECPYCNSTNYHLGIKNDFSRANCWKCGPHQLTQTLRLVSGASWDAIKGLGRFVVAESGHKTYGQYTPPTGLVDLKPRDRAYLTDRGFDPDALAAQWGLKSIGHLSKHKKGVFIPITHRGKSVSWTIRHREGPLRYTTAKDEEKLISEKDLVFGSDLCQGTIIVVEGPFDLFRVGIGGGCLFGLAYTQAQVRVLSRFHRRLLCFDNSPEAQLVADRLANDLAAFPGETLRVCLEAEDPGSADPEEIHELRKLAGI